MFDPRPLYRSAPAGARFHIALRWRLFDFSALIAYAPPEGVFLDIGCGHGLWTLSLAGLRPDARVWGIDPDGDKIMVARRAAQAGGLSNVRFEIGLAQQVEIPACDLASLVDVLYLIPYPQQEEILAAAVHHLRPGGRLLLKEMGERPRWKAIWNLAQETVSVRLLRITYGSQFYFRSTAAWIELLRNLGLHVDAVQLDRWHVHPHVLFVGEKP